MLLVLSTAKKMPLTILQAVCVFNSQCLLRMHHESSYTWHICERVCEAFMRNKKTIAPIFVDGDILGEPYVTSVSSKYFILLICVGLDNAVSSASGVQGGYRAGSLDCPYFHIHRRKLHQRHSSSVTWQQWL